MDMLGGFIEVHTQHENSKAEAMRSRGRRRTPSSSVAGPHGEELTPRALSALAFLLGVEAQSAVRLDDEKMSCAPLSFASGSIEAAVSAASRPSRSLLKPELGAETGGQIRQRGCRWKTLSPPSRVTK